MTAPALGLLPRRALSLAVRGYRLLLKPWLGNACRFEPSCSAYALQALDRHGAWRGSLFTAGRLLRCQPWCEGGCDPVPPAAVRLAAGLYSRHLPSHPASLPDAPPPLRTDP